MKRILWWGALAMGTLSAVAAPVPTQKEKPLVPGAYVATLPAFVCGGCAEWAQGHLQKDKRLDDVTVDATSRALGFRVKAGAVVTAAEIQKILDGAAAQMGMGADYTMKGLKPRPR